MRAHDHATSPPPRRHAAPRHDPRRVRGSHRQPPPRPRQLAAARRVERVSRDAGGGPALRAGDPGRCVARRRLNATRIYRINSCGDGRPVAPRAVRGPVQPRIGRGPVPAGRCDAAHRAPPEGHARAGRRGARQPVLRGQHTHPRELRCGVLPPRRLGVRHHRLHVLVDGQGRVDPRHQPRHRRLCRRDRRAPSRAGRGGRIRARHQRAGGQRRRRPR